MSATPLGTRSLKIKIGTTEFNTDVSNCRIIVGDSDADFMSFYDASTGGAKDFTLGFTATQDPADTTSIWRLVFDSAGTTAAVSVNPYGGTTASASTPLVKGTVVVSYPDGDLLGGDADASSSARFTTDYEWKFTAKPTLATTGAY